jgi:hypothetical protein
MVFTDGVNPPDPVLATGRQGHHHLNYHDKTITFGFRKERKFWPGRYDSSGKNFTPLDDVGTGTMNSPENQDRTLSIHQPGSVIQMTYDPEYDPSTRGVPNPHPFNLISLVVHVGELNVGTKSPTTGISACRTNGCRLRRSQRLVRPGRPGEHWGFAEDYFQPLGRRRQRFLYRTQQPGFHYHGWADHGGRIVSTIPP